LPGPPLPPQGRWREGEAVGPVAFSSVRNVVGGFPPGLELAPIIGWKEP